MPLNKFRLSGIFTVKQEVCPKERNDRNGNEYDLNCNGRDLDRLNDLQRGNTVDNRMYDDRERIEPELLFIPAGIENEYRSSDME